MKGLLGITILAAVAALLGIVYFVMDSNVDPTVTGKLYSFPAGDSLQEINLKNQYGTFTFSKENDQWGLIKPGKYRVNEQKIKVMENSLLELPINRILEEELEAYGFKAPVATVDMVSASGIEQSLVVGTMAPSQAQVYIKDARSGKIYICDMGFVAQLDGSLNAYRAKDIYAVDLFDLSTLTYFKDGEKQISLARSASQGWRLTYPFQANARLIEVNEFLVNLRKYSAAKFPDQHNPPREKMGLANPANILELTDAGGKTQRLEFGNVEEGLMYVRTGSREDIARIFAADVDFSILSAEKLLFETPLRATLDQVVKIEVLSSVSQIVIDLDQSTTPPHISSGGQELALQDFISFFVKYSTLSADGHQVGRPSGDATLTLKTTYVDGGTQMVRLLPRDGSSYYMETNGKTEFFLSKEKVSILLDRLNQAIHSGK